MFVHLLALSAAAFCSYALFVFTRNYVCQNRFKKLSPNMPIGPGSRGIFGGHTHLYCRMGNVKLMRQHLLSLGKTIVYFINHRPFVVTIDHDLVKKYAFDEKNDHSVRPPLMSTIKQLESDCLIMASGDQLSRLRPVYASAFSSRNIKLPYVMEQIKLSVDKLIDSFDWRMKHHGGLIDGEASVEINLDNLITNYTVDLVFSTLHKQKDLVDFKLDSQTLVKGALRGSRSFIERSQTFFVMFPFFNPFFYELSKLLELSLHHFIDKYEKSAREIASSYYEARKQYNEEMSKTNQQVEFYKLNRYRMKDGKQFSRGLLDFIIDKLYDQTISFKEYLNSSFFLHDAAERTSSDLIIDIIVMLAVNPQNQDKLRKSIMEEGEKSQYLNWCIMETIRLMPPVPGGALRELEHDITTNDGLFIPKGSMITSPPYAFHRVKEIWGDDAEEFKPERWADEKNFLPYQFVGFGAGRRICLGRDYAMAHIKMLFVALISKFKFEPSPRTDHNMDFGSLFFILLVREKPAYVTLKYINT